MPQRQRKRRYLHLEDASARYLTAQYRGHVWSYDFVFDVTENGRTLKAMPVVDEFTRECHSILVGRTINAAGAAREIRRLVCLHGAPAFIRSDNGPEFIARALREELAALGTETRYIEPGSPWQNASVESFNARLRDEVLDRVTESSLATSWKPRRLSNGGVWNTTKNIHTAASDTSHPPSLLNP